MPSPYAGVDNFPVNVNIPSGGDTRNAVSVNVPLEGALDRTTWLKNRTSGKFLYFQNFSNHDDTANPPSAYFTSGGTGAFVHVTGGPSITIFDSNTNDIIEVEFDFTALLTQSNASSETDLEIRFNAATHVAGSNKRIGSAGATVDGHTEYHAVHLKAYYTNPGSFAGPFTFDLYANPRTVNFSCVGSWTAFLKQWRAT